MTGRAHEVQSSIRPDIEGGPVDDVAVVRIPGGDVDVAWITEARGDKPTVLAIGICNVAESELVRHGAADGVAIVPRLAKPTGARRCPADAALRDALDVDVIQVNPPLVQIVKDLESAVRAVGSLYQQRNGSDVVPTLTSGSGVMSSPRPDNLIGVIAEWDREAAAPSKSRLHDVVEVGSFYIHERERTVDLDKSWIAGEE